MFTGKIELFPQNDFGIKQQYFMLVFSEDFKQIESGQRMTVLKMGSKTIDNYGGIGNLSYKLKLDYNFKITIIGDR